KYMVDGHNLIGSIPDISLDDPDDEEKLIRRLKQFCLASAKHRVEVYFDRAAPASARKMNAGPVTAYFVKADILVDAAIEDRLRKLKQSAKEWTVVSSDGRVQNSAREAHAKVISSQDFAGLMAQTILNPARNAPLDQDPLLSEDEVEEWRRLFHSGRE
ncbi:MAG: NYN domain-containing protein, partial [Desulforhabdus sp.]|nr:NYN domain-containing protein [Desulforhabdus sp.]